MREHEVLLVAVVARVRGVERRRSVADSRFSDHLPRPELLACQVELEPRMQEWPAATRPPDRWRPAPIEKGRTMHAKDYRLIAEHPLRNIMPP